MAIGVILTFLEKGCIKLNNHWDLQESTQVSIGQINNVLPYDKQNSN